VKNRQPKIVQREFVKYKEMSFFDDEGWAGGSEDIQGKIYCPQIEDFVYLDEAVAYLNQGDIICIQCELRISCALTKGEKPKDEGDY
jgi:hypothetical protein